MFKTQNLGRISGVTDNLELVLYRPDGFKVTSVNRRRRYLDYPDYGDEEFKCIAGKDGFDGPPGEVGPPGEEGHVASFMVAPAPAGPPGRNGAPGRNVYSVFTILILEAVKCLLDQTDIYEHFLFTACRNMTTKVTMMAVWEQRPHLSLCQLQPMQYSALKIFDFLASKKLCQKHIFSFQTRCIPKETLADYASHYGRTRNARYARNNRYP